MSEKEQRHQMWRWLFLTIWAIISMVGLWHLPQWPRAERMENYVPSQWAKNWFTFSQINRDFGYDRSLVIALETAKGADLFERKIVQLNRDLTKSLQDISGIQRVLSLSNSVTVYKQDDAMAVRPLFPEKLEQYGPKEREQSKKLALNDPLLRGSLLSNNGRATLVIAFLHTKDNPLKTTTPHISGSANIKQTGQVQSSETQRVAPHKQIVTDEQVVERVLALIAQLKKLHPDVRWGVIGEPFVGPLLRPLVTKDAVHIFFLIGLWVAILLLLVVPSWQRKLWVVGMAIGGIFLGLLAHIGWYRELNLSAVAIPLFVWWILGFWVFRSKFRYIPISKRETPDHPTQNTDTLQATTAEPTSDPKQLPHTQTQTTGEFGAEPTSEPTPQLTPQPEDRRWLWLGTTSVAVMFLLLWTDSWPLLQNFGLTLFLSTIGLLALILIFPPPPLSQSPNADLTETSASPVDSAATGSTQPGKPPVFYRTTTRWLLWSGLVGLAAGIFFMPKGLSSLQQLYPSHSLLYNGVSIMRDQLGGSEPFFIRFKGDLNHPMQLKSMERVGRRLEQIPDISALQSYTILLRRLHALLNRVPRIPDSANQIAPLSLFIEGQPALASLIRLDNRDALLQGSIALQNSWRQGHLLTAFDSALRELPLRYEQVDWLQATPPLRKQLIHQRTQWVSEGVTLWLKRHTQIAITPEQRQSIKHIVSQYLNQLTSISHKPVVLDNTRLARALSRYLASEDCDLDIPAPLRPSILRLILNANLNGQLQDTAALQKLLKDALKDTAASEDLTSINYAIRSIQQIAQRIEHQQLIDQLQQQLFNFFHKLPQWSAAAQRALSSGDLDASRERVLELEAELLELHNPHWYRTDRGTTQLQIDSAGLHQLLIPLAIKTTQHGLRTALIMILASLLLMLLLIKPISTSFRAWLPLPLTCIAMLGIASWLQIPLSLPLVLSLIMLIAILLIPSLYLQYTASSTQQHPTLSNTLSQMALWLSLPLSPLLFSSLPLIQEFGIALILCTWTGLLIAALCTKQTPIKMCNL